MYFKLRDNKLFCDFQVMAFTFNIATSVEGYVDPSIYFFSNTRLH